MKEMNSYVKSILVFQLFILYSIPVFGQENQKSEIISETKIDSLYREDQFFIGVTYNLLNKTPIGFSNDKFAAGLTAGFLRDMPINARRNLAIAPGLGLTFNNYNQNIGILTTNGVPGYFVLNDPTQYSNNKFSQLLVDVPLELRWRGSTFQNHTFFRIHAGVKLSYLLFDRSVFSSNMGDVVINNNPDFNKIQYGLFAAAGYGSANLYIQYGLNSLFKTAQIAGNPINARSLNIGLVFYIL
jgi:hypothetical protein